ncbi:hypothetical protein SLS55_008747 [Diplodia seriata]|uniref:Uncharacterized protein n=1 Tax=Diplodia seriata TaxID=420778 RepID=A0A0G2EXI3_9PEZI|nr:hypothetical protein UCDDS831_g01158 [Diplodia seriata]
MSHTGGNLSDMAVKGTDIPNDAGRMNTIPSKPAPDSIHDAAPTNNPVGSRPDQASASGAFDAARSTTDTGMTGEVTTGTGDALPASIESKRLDFDASQHAPGGHGKTRDTKQVQHKDDFSRMAAPGEDANDAPGDTR